MFELVSVPPPPASRRVQLRGGLQRQADAGDAPEAVVGGREKMRDSIGLPWSVETGIRAREEGGGRPADGRETPGHGATSAAGFPQAAGLLLN